jgi:flavoprotein
MLADKALEKFKKTFKEKYGVEYTDTEVREASENLVRYFELLIKIDQENKQKELVKNKKS